RLPPGRRLAPQWTWLRDELPGVHALLISMLDPAPESRPTARECARRLADLRHETAGEPLEDWAPGALAAVTAADEPAPDRGGPTLRIGETFTHGEPPPRKERSRLGI